MKRNVSPTRAGADGLALALQQGEGGQAPQAACSARDAAPTVGLGLHLCRAAEGWHLPLQMGTLGPCQALPLQQACRVLQSCVGPEEDPSWGSCPQGDPVWMALCSFWPGISPASVLGRRRYVVTSLRGTGCSTDPSSSPASCLAAPATSAQGAASTSHDLPDRATCCCKRSSLPAPQLCSCLAPSPHSLSSSLPRGWQPPRCPRLGDWQGPKLHQPCAAPCRTAMAFPSCCPSLPAGNGHCLPRDLDLGHVPLGSGLGRVGSSAPLGAPALVPPPSPWFSLRPGGRAAWAGSCSLRPPQGPG